MSDDDNRRPGPPSNWRAIRRRIIDRDDEECIHCGTSAEAGAELHVHHIVPRAVGESHNDENLVTLCSQCHYAVHGERRSARSPEWEKSVSPDELETDLVLHPFEDGENPDFHIEDTTTQEYDYRTRWHVPLWVRMKWWIFGEETDRIKHQ